jgi:hypothetical protein
VSCKEEIVNLELIFTAHFTTFICSHRKRKTLSRTITYFTYIHYTRLAFCTKKMRFSLNSKKCKKKVVCCCFWRVKDSNLRPSPAMASATITPKIARDHQGRAGHESIMMGNRGRTWGRCATTAPTGLKFGMKVHYFAIYDRSESSESGKLAKICV